MLLALALGLAAPISAQDRSRVSSEATLRREPRGSALAVVSAGTAVTPVRTRGDWLEVSLEGWIFTRSVEKTDRDGFDLVVSASDGENLRDGPNGAVVARLEEGTLLDRVTSRGGWTRVRRVGWIPRAATGRAAPRTPADTSRSATLGASSDRKQGQRQARQPQGNAAAATPGAGSPKPAGSSPSPAAATPAESGVDRVEAVGDMPLLLAPDSQRVATLQRGATGRVVARAGDWVRVSVEGWAKASDLRPAGDSIMGVSAAEIRADPDRYIGRTVEWRVQLIAVQIADELRTEMPEGQPYLLTRGPLPEPGFVYVMIPRSEVERFRGLPALQELTLRVTIKAAKTRYLNTPVAELVAVRSGTPQ